MKRKADAWAALCCFFQGYCESLPGYDHANPDPELVIVRNKRLFLRETFDQQNYEGCLVAIGDGKYEIRVRAHQGIQTANKPELYRRRFTIAHEIGHFCVEENLSQILAILGIERWRSYRERENVCHCFAAEFLMPPDQLREAAQDLFRLHPLDALKRLSLQFQVTIQPLILQLSRIAATDQSNWFIGLFEFRLNPGKPQEDKKWRLMPGCICLPQGLSSATEGVYDNRKIYIDPPRAYAGLDTMRLCLPGWCREPDWKWIYEQLVNLRSTYSTGVDMDAPWTDLNTPIPYQGKRKHYIYLHSQKLKILAGLGVIPLSISLFGDACDVPVPANYANILWDDENWRLQASDLRVEGRLRSKTAGPLLVTAQLSLFPRISCRTNI